MAHQHQHNPGGYNRAFAIGVGLNLAYVIVEETYGYLSHSLALVADAGHNLSDVLGLLLAWGASRLALRRPSPRRTYGWRRTSILAALINAVILLVAVGGIAFEAVRRIGSEADVATRPVIVVALVGIAVNGVTAMMFASGRSTDLNVRGAFLHLAADAAVSAGVVVAAVVMLVTGWDWLDPIVSLAIVVVIFAGTWGLLRDSVNLALDAVPEGIDPAQVATHLLSMPGVVDLHDLHIWSMSTSESALTVHLVVADDVPNNALVVSIYDDLHDRFGIEHATIQLENDQPPYPCRFSTGTGV